MTVSKLALVASVASASPNTWGGEPVKWQNCDTDADCQTGVMYMSYKDYTDKPATKCAWWISGDWADIGCYTPDSCGYDPVNCEMPIIPQSSTSGIIFEEAAATATDFDPSQMSSGTKTAIIIDDQKLTEAAQEVAMAAEGVVFSPDGQQIGQALSNEIQRAVIKTDMASSQILTPLLEEVLAQIDERKINKECPIHELYQCVYDVAVSEGRENNVMRTYGQWDMLNQTGCGAQTGCYIKETTAGFDYIASDGASDGRQDDFLAAVEGSFMPMGDDLMQAAMEQQNAAANIAQSLGPSLQSILINYGCDSTCMTDIPDNSIEEVALAASYCSCPVPVTISEVDSESLRRRASPVKQVLKKLGAPEYGTATFSKASMAYLKKRSMNSLY